MVSSNISLLSPGRSTLHDIKHSVDGEIEVNQERDLIFLISGPNQSWRQILSIIDKVYKSPKATVATKQFIPMPSFVLAANAIFARLYAMCTSPSMLKARNDGINTSRCPDFVCKQGFICKNGFKCHLQAGALAAPFPVLPALEFRLVA